MDPLTQGVLGAAATQAIFSSRVPDELRPKLWWLGALGGMAADLDVLLRWPSDPMVALTLHRHFTHSLAFIPIGGLLVALPFAARAPRSQRAFIAAATTCGYATHALLDAFTSYGTLLWWPFSESRVAWNVISIIDPIYTITLGLGVWLARRRLDARPALLAMILSSLYMGLCAVQRAQVRTAHAALLKAAGIDSSARFVFPQLLANTRWRALSVEGDTLRAYAIAKPWFGPARYLVGTTQRRFDRADAPPEMFDGPGGGKVREALATIAWFSGDRIYIEAEGHDPGRMHASWWRVCDARYSRAAASFEGIFCWRLEPGNATLPVSQLRMSPKSGDSERLNALMPFGGLDAYSPISAIEARE